ncbi:uncharacterized mitochondrial protein AtMg00810-like [Pyrus x bretschneideri]|uniref:uncharacterized mitochondrial protein AtMg00810-like n=1 Tax=Pyrus x bretschneideri TaxID=225117 RepID=UPI00202E2004|nr:uncharacterized mitochondrial protein AtMg00810-like [Pyrus x bretschneideri]
MTSHLEVESNEEIETESDHGGSIVEEDSQVDEASPFTGRTRRPPTWMRDYKTGQGLSDEENEEGARDESVSTEEGSIWTQAGSPSLVQSYFSKEGFNKCPFEHTLFIKTAEEGKILIVCLYVDDLIFTGNDKMMFEQFKKSMMVEFDMTYLGKMRYFLGIEVIQGFEGIFISQRKYAQEILERFNMDQCNSVLNPIVPGYKLTKDEGGIEVDGNVYKQMVGSLMYLTATRPDLMFVVSLISRYMERPTEVHMQTAKRVLRYVKGTTDLGIFYKKGGTEELIGYTDSDYAGDQVDRKSTSGYVFMVNMGAVSWS